MNNPAALKLELVLHGVRLDQSVRARKDVFPAPWVRDFVTRGIELVLPEDIVVCVPVSERFTESSPFLLRSADDRFVLSRGEEEIEVRVVPQPRYYTRRTRSGTPMWKVGTAYSGYVAVNPATACDFVSLGVPCKFCDVETRGGNRGKPLPVSDVVETLRAAFEEGVADFVYLHMGYMDGEDRGVRFLIPYIEAIKRHFDTLIAVQVQPPATNAWIDRTYASGADALSYSIEIHDPELLERYCAGRARRVGRQRYYDALAYAARIFPSGTVWSDLVVGLEPPESTIAGIDTLVAMNVLPVLSVFRPLGDTPLREHPVPSVEVVTPVFAHLYRAVRGARINMNWVRDLGFAVTPLEARFFAGEGSPPGLSQIYRSRLGTFAARNLSRMRRRLRVRKVSDSFDSSQL